MSEQRLYHYDENGEMTAQGYIDLDIYKTVPPMSTLKQPPLVEENEIAIFNISEKSWEVEDDYVGEIYYDTEGNKIEISEIGVSPDNSWTKEKTYSTLDEAKNDKVSEVKREAYRQLEHTDWCVIRNQETGEAVPQDVLDKRQNIREQSDMIVNDINDLTTIEEVESYSISF